MVSKQGAFLEATFGAQLQNEPSLSVLVAQTHFACRIIPPILAAEMT